MLSLSLDALSRGRIDGRGLPWRTFISYPSNGRTEPRQQGEGSATMLLGDASVKKFCSVLTKICTRFPNALVVAVDSELFGESARSSLTKWSNNSTVQHQLSDQWHQ